jgi:hypothetical protein
MSLMTTARAFFVDYAAHFWPFIEVPHLEQHTRLKDKLITFINDVERVRNKPRREKLKEEIVNLLPCVLWSVIEPFVEDELTILSTYSLSVSRTCFSKCRLALTYDPHEDSWMLWRLRPPTLKIYCPNRTSFSVDFFMVGFEWFISDVDTTSSHFLKQLQQFLSIPLPHELHLKGWRCRETTIQNGTYGTLLDLIAQVSAQKVIFCVDEHGNENPVTLPNLHRFTIRLNLTQIDHNTINVNWYK